MSSPSVVHLWFCSLAYVDDISSSIVHLKKWLTDDERMKAARYRQPSARERALYVRGFLRVVLSQYASLSPGEWCFEYGDKGKPRLCREQRQRTGLAFNLSHSGDHLLLGIIKAGEEGAALGVDIEYARSNIDIYPILNHYFSPQEVATILALPQQCQRQRFFDLWALKESYIKATGQGLAKSLKSFDFDLSVVRKDRQARLPVDGLDSSVDSEFGTGLELYHDIDLRILDDSSQPNSHAYTNQASSNQIQWQTCLGRLDEQYRFAVTLGGAMKKMELDARLISPSQLIELYPQ